MQDEKTPNLSLPLPHPDNTLDADVVRLREALRRIDAAIADLIQNGPGGPAGPAEPGLVKNTRLAWVIDQDIPAGSIYTLPESYYPGRNTLFLLYDNAPCTPKMDGSAAPYQYEEVGSDQDTLSNQVIFSFDLEKGAALDMLCQGANPGGSSAPAPGGSNKVTEFSVVISSANPGPVITTSPYVVGATTRENRLFVYLSGSYCARNLDYEEVGPFGSVSMSIRVFGALIEGEIINGFTG